MAPGMTTISEAARQHGITRQRMLALVKQGRVPYARQRSDGIWHLPQDFKIRPPPERKRAPEKITTSPL